MESNTNFNSKFQTQLTCFDSRNLVEQYGDQISHCKMILANKLRGNRSWYVQQRLDTNRLYALRVQSFANFLRAARFLHFLSLKLSDLSKGTRDTMAGHDKRGVLLPLDPSTAKMAHVCVGQRTESSYPTDESSFFVPLPALLYFVARHAGNQSRSRARDKKLALGEMSVGRIDRRVSGQKIGVCSTRTKGTVPRDAS